MTGAATVEVLGPGGPALELIAGGGSAHALVWPGCGARLRSLHLLSLDAGARTHPQTHDGEAVYYVIAGTGHAGAPDATGSVDLREGSMVHVAPSAPYAFVADEGGLELIGGPAPPDPRLYAPLGRGVPPLGVAGGHGANDARGAIRGFHRDDPDVRLPMIASDARFVVWAGAGAMTANMNYVAMEPGEENVPHEHMNSEDTIYILSGRGTAEDLTHGLELSFAAGQVIQVPPGVRHRVRADQGTAVISVGGPCPADLALLRAAGLLGDGER